MPDNVRIGQNYTHDGTYLQGVSTSNRREYPGNSSDDNRSYRGQRYPNERGRPPDEGDIPTEMEDLQEEEDHKIMEDPQWTQRTP